MWEKIAPSIDRPTDPQYRDKMIIVQSCIVLIFYIITHYSLTGVMA